MILFQIEQCAISKCASLPHSLAAYFFLPILILRDIYYFRQYRTELGIRMAKFATVGIFLFIPLVLCTSISTSKVGDSDGGGGGGGGDPHSRPGSRARVAKRNISDRRNNLSSQNMTRWPTNYAMVSNHTNPGVYFELL